MVKPTLDWAKNYARGVATADWETAAKNWHDKNIRITAVTNYSASGINPKIALKYALGIKDATYRKPDAKKMIMKYAYKVTPSGGDQNSYYGQAMDAYNEAQALLGKTVEDVKREIGGT